MEWSIDLEKDSEKLDKIQRSKIRTVESLTKLFFIESSLW